MSIRVLLLFLFTPSLAFASDMAALLFLPCWAISLVCLLSAFAVANRSKSKKGYWGLGVCILLSLFSTLAIIFFLGISKLGGPFAIQVILFLLLIIPFRILDAKRLIR